jgi:hypothetical protein
MGLFAGIVGVIRSGLARFSELENQVPAMALFAVALLLMLVSTISKDLVMCLSASLLALVAVLIMLEPGSADSIIFLGLVAGSVLITIHGIQSRRRAAAASRKLDALTRAVNRLEAAEDRRFMTSIKTEPLRIEEDPLSPSEEPGEARRT